MDIEFNTVGTKSNKTVDKSKCDLKGIETFILKRLTKYIVGGLTTRLITATLVNAKFLDASWIVGTIISSLIFILFDLATFCDKDDVLNIPLYSTLKSLSVSILVRLSMGAKLLDQGFLLSIIVGTVVGQFFDELDLGDIM